MKFHIQWEDQHHYWRHYQTVHHQQQAVRTAKSRATSTQKRWRVVSDDGSLLDLINP